MAEMVGSVVVGEVVNRTFSFLINKHSRERLSTREGVERLEMAHIKMEAALELSGRWQHHATDADASLLRWRRKLRRAADECDAAQHRFLGVGPASPAEVWAGSKPCRAYPNRRPSSGKKLLVV